MLIRKAELQDVRAVYALICELEEQDLPLLEFENIFGSLLKLPEHFLMIGEIEGRTVAFLHLRVEGQLHHAAKIAEILEFDVERSHRGRNLGQQFFAYAEKLARDNGCIQFELSRICCGKRRIVSMNGKACINFTINLRSLCLEKQ